MKLLRFLLCCAAAFVAAQLLAEVPPVPTTLTCDHMDMWSEGEETRAICTGNVTLVGTNMSMTCDRLELIATRIDEDSGAVPTLEKFKYLLATGKVKITQGTRGATCGRAEVFPREERSCSPKIPWSWIARRSSSAPANASRCCAAKSVCWSRNRA